jgi:YVTN family beta-propeller protein
MKRRKTRSILLLVAAPSVIGAQTLVVLNKAEASASLIDVASGKTVGSLRVGRGPHELALSPDRRLAYVANFGRYSMNGAGDSLSTRPGNTLTVLDLERRVPGPTWSFGTHTGQHGVATSRDGKLVWVTSETPNALLEIEANSGLIKHVWPTDQQRSHLVLPSADERKFYVTNTVSGSVTVIDRATGAVKSLALGAGAEGLTLSPNGKELWVAWRAGNRISILSTSTDEVIATIDAGGDGPQRIQFTPNGAEVWTSNVRSNTLGVFDASTRKLIATVPVGAGPAGIVFAPDGKRGYFALSSANHVAVVDVAGRKVVGTIATGVEPDGIAYIPR